MENRIKPSHDVQAETGRGPGGRYRAEGCGVGLLFFQAPNDVGIRLLSK